MEYRIDYEGDNFALTEQPAEDILRITAVHPIREEALKKLLLEARID